MTKPVLSGRRSPKSAEAKGGGGCAAWPWVGMAMPLRSSGLQRREFQKMCICLRHQHCQEKNLDGTALPRYCTNIKDKAQTRWQERRVFCLWHKEHLGSLSGVNQPQILPSGHGRRATYLSDLRPEPGSCPVSVRRAGGLRAQ